MGPRVTASSASTRSSRNAWPDGRQKSERHSERSSRAVHRSRSATSRGSSRTCGSRSLGRVEPELLLASEPRHVLVEPRARLRRDIDPEVRTNVDVAVRPAAELPCRRGSMPNSPRQHAPTMDGPSRPIAEFEPRTPARRRRTERSRRSLRPAPPGSVQGRAGR